MQIGRDPRLSGAALQAGLTAGLTSQGVHVAHFGLATTPAMFMSCIIGGTSLASWIDPETLSINMVIVLVLGYVECQSDKAEWLPGWIGKGHRDIKLRLAWAT